MPIYNPPIFPSGSNAINAQLSFDNKDGYITYFNFCTPIHRHPIDDTKTFRLLICSFCSLGSCRPCEIVKAFGINERTLMRDLELYRTEGSAGFFKTVKRGGPRVITESVKPEIEKLLSQGNSLKDVAAELNIGYEALRKAVQRGKIDYKKKLE
jgi:transposase